MSHACVLYINVLYMVLDETLHHFILNKICTNKYCIYLDKKNIFFNLPSYYLLVFIYDKYVVALGVDT